MIEVTIKVIIFLFFMFATAFFSAAETAITSLTNASIRKMKEKYNRLYKYVVCWEKEPDDIITTLLVWMNMSVVAVGVTTTSLGYDIIEMYNLNKAQWLGVFPIVAIIITLIFGNLIPKTFSRYKAESLSIICLPIVVTLTKLSKHTNSFLVSISKFILNIFGGQTQEPKVMQPDEVELLLSNENVSPLSSMSRNIVNKIIEFRKTKVSQVMVPVSNIVAVNIEQTKDKIMQDIIDAQFSRIPIYRKTINNIIGIVIAKDIATALRDSEIVAIQDLIRPVYYVPETANTKKLLMEFRKGKHHMAIVVDEFGSTIGLVTMEDLLEEIVGEVWDEYDEKDENIVKLKDGRFLVKASTSISDINDQLKLTIPEDNFSTINGWVLEKFGYIPKKFEKFSWNNIEVEIETADTKKVKRVILKII